MASEKTVNYTAEQEQFLAEGYTSGESVEALAEKVGKTVRSVVAKLSRMGLYKAKSREAKTSTAMTKAKLVLELEARVGLEAGVLATFEKADKAALEALLARM